MSPAAQHFSCFGLESPCAATTGATFDEPLEINFITLDIPPNLT